MCSKRAVVSGFPSFSSNTYSFIHLSNIMLEACSILKNLLHVSSYFPFSWRFNLNPTFFCLSTSHFLVILPFLILLHLFFPPSVLYPLYSSFSSSSFIFFLHIFLLFPSIIIFQPLYKFFFFTPNQVSLLSSFVNPLTSMKEQDKIYPYHTSTIGYQEQKR